MCVREREHTSFPRSPSFLAPHLVEGNDLGVLSGSGAVVEDAEEQGLVVGLDGVDGQVEDGILRRQREVGNPRAARVVVEVVALCGRWKGEEG